VVNKDDYNYHRKDKNSVEKHKKAITSLRDSKHCGQWVTTHTPTCRITFS